MSAMALAVPDEPMACCHCPVVICDDGLQFVARGEFRLLEILLGDLAVREEAVAVADAAHVQALEDQRLRPLPMMNSVEPPPMSITSAVVLRLRQAVRDAEIDQARFLAPGDDFDREIPARARPAG